ncbi:MAG: fructose-6-phosphate aldolase [Myxococcales bacterium]|nr:fructose-6-phosphate aldolase [Myxococcales bacterium]
MSHDLQFFLDTASLDEIRRWQAIGLVQGVTTNPALLAKEGGDPLEQLRRVAELVEGPVSAQVTRSESAGMVPQGRALARVAPNVVVKVPATLEGFRAAQQLTDDGIVCNITLAFDPSQGIPFARIPVGYLSLILGRVEDFGEQHAAYVARCREMLDALGSPTRLLVASLRNPHHLQAAISGGADVVTVPPATWNHVHANPLTQQGERDFMTSWQTLDPTLRGPYERLGQERQSERPARPAAVAGA